MSLKRASLIGFIIFMAVFSIHASGFSQPKGDKVFSFPGVIENVIEDPRSIVVSEIGILISPDAKITDEKGTVLKFSGLKRGDRVLIDCHQKENRLLATKIVLKGRK